MTAIIIFFILHWYVSLFFQTFFAHRYAAHKMITMSPAWEKVFFVLSWIGQGSSYIGVRAYGIMHRMHHAYADTEKDPHSPKFSDNLFDMMLKTQAVYSKVFWEKVPFEERFTKGVPAWKSFEVFANSIPVRIAWGLIYIAFYAYFAPNAWWYLLLPLHFIMGPLHGAIINWFAHRIGYRNFDVSDLSRNLMPVDIFMMGEGYHNNHHKHGSRPNFGVKWHEVDPTYLIMKGMAAIGIIKWRRNPVSA
ncbi:MAG: acyl-CoA desaturase [Bacteroidota bacterium]